VQADQAGYCALHHLKRGAPQFAVGAERDLYAAAMRFQVRIVCFEVSDNGKMKRAEYLPQEGVEPRADLFLCRKGEHFVSARALQGSNTGAGGEESFFCNIQEEDVLTEMREKAQYMGLKFEEAGTAIAAETQKLPLHAATDTETTDAEVFTWAAGPPRDVRGGRRLLREVVQMQGETILDMSEKHYSAGGNNFFTSFAVELKNVGVPIKTAVVSAGNTGKGSALDIEAASRQARSEVIMYSTAHAAKFANMPSPIKELAAAACKFNVQITCYDLIKGVVSKNVYLPKGGVTPRAELVLGRDGDKFWSTSQSPPLIDPSAVPLVQDEIMEIPAGADIPVGYDDEVNNGPSAALSSADALNALNEENEGAEPEERGVVFDKKTLSWKMMTKEEQARVQAELAAGQPAPNPMEGKTGNYLPRFSKFKSNPNSAAPSSHKATVADAMLAGQISSRNGKVNIDTVALANRRASAGITNDVQMSAGMLQLEAEFAEQGAIVDFNQGGGNAYLVTAELMYTQKLEIQGLMFTMWGEERRNSLVGAMSRKAREDVKAYMYHNPEVFAQAGQWVGDHDMRAMARCYKMRIIVSRVIYDDQIEECVYEPEEGTKPRGELRVILDRKLFWAVKTLEAFEKQEAGEEEEEEEEVEVVKKPRSALEKVLAKYGKMEEEEEEEVKKVAKIVPKKSEKGDKSIIGFKDMHTVKSRDHTATVIWLHGLGGQGKEWTEMAEALHMPWVKFVFPASQPVPLDLWDGRETSAWFDLSPGAYQVHSNSMNAVPSVISRIYSKIQPDCEKIETSAALVQELVRKEIKNGISPDKIILAGFSQGATIALHAALSMEEQIAGVVALSMWHLPSITGSEAAEASKREEKLPVLFCHGAKDNVITAEFAEHMCGEMSCALDVNFKQFDDLAHGICADELSAVRQFLAGRIPGQTKYDSVNQLPPTYRRQNVGIVKSNAKVWGDGSEVSARRSDAEFQAVATEDKAALDSMVQDAVRNNLENFATNFVDPGAELWVDLRQAVHDKSRKQQK